MRGSHSDVQNTLGMLDSIEFEESKDSNEIQQFYNYLALTPYRKQLLIEAFLYKAYSEDEQGFTDKSFSTLNTLLKVLSTLATCEHNNSLI